MNDTLRTIKVLISALYWLLFLSWGDLLGWTGLVPYSRSMVLLYHGVQREERGRFEWQMRQLLRMARPVSLESVDTLTHMPKDGAGNDRRACGLTVAVTFDDAFVSVAENAVDILANLHIPAAIFVPVASMGRRPGWCAGADSDKAIMTAEQVRALQSDLLLIASHSVTHPHMPQVDSASLQWEMVHSRELLEEITGRPIRFFSYPYGEWSPREELAAREAGYERTFTIEPIPTLPGSRSPAGRVCVEPGDGHIEFRLKLLGAYRWMPWASFLKRSLMISPGLLSARKEPVRLHDDFTRTDS